MRMMERMDVSNRRPDNLDPEALRLALAYRHGHGRKSPQTRQADEDMVHAAGDPLAWSTWTAGRHDGIVRFVMVHVWAAFGDWPAVVEVVTYFGQHDLDVDAYFADELPAGWPDWLAIVGLS